MWFVVIRCNHGLVVMISLMRTNITRGAGHPSYTHLSAILHAKVHHSAWIDTIRSNWYGFYFEGKTSVATECTLA